MSNHRHVTCHFHVWLTMPDATMMSEYMIYMVWKLIAMFCPITCVMFMLTISKIGCHRLTQQCWHICTNEILEIWKLHILWHNLIKYAWIFLKPSEQTFFYPDDSNEGEKPYAHTKTTHIQNLVQIKKQKISLNFWVIIGMWPVISVWLMMPNATMISEYMIYMVWKLAVTFCPITCVMFIWQFWKLVVTG